MLTFSQVNLPGGQVAKNITSLGTGNFSISNAESSFNVWRIVPNNATMYNEASAYIAKMRSDKDQRTSKVKAVALGETTMYLYPQKSYTPDLQLDLLKATSCKGAKKTIRVAQYMWTLGRKPIADRLAVLKKSGCDVKVILNNDSNLLNASVLRVLLKAKIPVYNAHRLGKVHTHAKDFYISARVGGKQQNLVVSGSLNLTRGSLNANDEAGYKINSAVGIRRVQRSLEHLGCEQQAHRRSLGGQRQGDHGAHHQRPDPDRGLISRPRYSLEAVRAGGTGGRPNGHLAHRP